MCWSAHKGCHMYTSKRAPPRQPYFRPDRGHFVRSQSGRCWAWNFELLERISQRHLQRLHICRELRTLIFKSRALGVMDKSPVSLFRIQRLAEYSRRPVPTSFGPAKLCVDPNLKMQKIRDPPSSSSRFQAVLLKERSPPTSHPMSGSAGR